ncbi:DNA-processing protein DprA [Intrasporangium flavum]|uniref:DNA-processing protein DprA n=1 Tax=Intrasporangium flavum TaxID=1428657 RepID=UPI00096ECB24|nr:DNA-processing protein DprA [Intrasporangium flavum]
MVEPRDVEVAALLQEVGPLEAMARIRSGHGTLARFAARVRALHVERDLEVAAKVGARVVVPGDAEWAEALDSLPIPPWCLWVVGRLDLVDTTRRSVAVVGARAATSYGEHVTTDLAAGLARRQWTVVSGAALGIDAAAHHGALAVDGTTVAVVAGGVDRPYPAANATLLRRIAEVGLVVSEAAPGAAPMKSRFLSRNRLIAALTRGTVVVEADLRSGSRNTVTHATGLSRPVGAVPGPVTSMMSAGCHQEIRDQKAVLVTSVDEIIDLVGDIGDDACDEPRAPDTVVDRLSTEDRAVLEAVPFRRPVALDVIARDAARPPLVVRAALARLEQARLVIGESGTWRKAPAPRRKTASTGSAGSAGSAGSSGSSVRAPSRPRPALDAGPTLPLG